MRHLVPVALLLIGCESMKPAESTLPPTQGRQASTTEDVQTPEATPEEAPEPFAVDTDVPEAPEDPLIDEQPDGTWTVRPHEVRHDEDEGTWTIHHPPEEVAEEPPADIPVVTPMPSVNLHSTPRLIAVIPNTQPPRAILGLTTGEEIVVEPGTMIPHAGVVVLAIGEGGVQIAEVIPEGDHVSLESHNLVPLHRQLPAPTTGPGTPNR